MTDRDMNENEEKQELIRAMTALDIRQSAMRSLELYHDRIARHMSKRSLLPSDRDVKKRLARAARRAQRGSC